MLFLLLGGHNTVFSLPNQLVETNKSVPNEKQNGGHETSTEKLTIVTPKYVIQEVDLNSIHDFTHQVIYHIINRFKRIVLMVYIYQEGFLPHGCSYSVLSF